MKKIIWHGVVIILSGHMQATQLTDVLIAGTGDIIVDYLRSNARECNNSLNALKHCSHGVESLYRDLSTRQVALLMHIDLTKSSEDFKQLVERFVGTCKNIIIKNTSGRQYNPAYYQQLQSVIQRCRIITCYTIPLSMIINDIQLSAADSITDLELKLTGSTPSAENALRDYIVQHAAHFKSINVSGLSEAFYNDIKPYLDTISFPNLDKLMLSDSTCSRDIICLWVSRTDHLKQFGYPCMPEFENAILTVYPFAKQYIKDYGTAALAHLQQCIIDDIPACILINQQVIADAEWLQVLAALPCYEEILIQDIDPTAIPGWPAFVHKGCKLLELTDIQLSDVLLQPFNNVKNIDVRYCSLGNANYQQRALACKNVLLQDNRNSLEMMAYFKHARTVNLGHLDFGNNAFDADDTCMYPTYQVLRVDFYSVLIWRFTNRLPNICVIHGMRSVQDYVQALINFKKLKYIGNGHKISSYLLLNGSLIQDLLRALPARDNGYLLRMFTDDCGNAQKLVVPIASQESFKHTFPYFDQSTVEYRA